MAKLSARNSFLYKRTLLSGFRIFRDLKSRKMRFFPLEAKFQVTTLHKPLTGNLERCEVKCLKFDISGVEAHGMNPL